MHILGANLHARASQSSPSLSSGLAMADITHHRHPAAHGATLSKQFTDAIALFSVVHQRAVSKL
jgi:hypothetical protein